MNTEYNKTVYGTLAAAITILVAYIASQYGYDFPPEVQGAVTTIITMIVVYAVPNKEPAPQPEDRAPGIDTVDFTQFD